MAASPTPPQPNTATESPRPTLPVLIAAPMPAITPQPSRPAAVAGAAGSTFVHCPRSASARSPRRRSSPRDSAPRSTRPAPPTAAGLLGCGVMAGIGAAINTGGSAAATRSRCSAAAVSATRRSPAHASPGQRRSSPSTSTTASSSGRRSFGATHTVNASTTDPVEASASHRRLRRRRVHRGGRPSRGLSPGVLRPRPRGHRRAGRRAHARHDASNSRSSSSSGAAAR